MASINENYTNLPGNYLFAELARRVRAYQRLHPKEKLIHLGIGDIFSRDNVVYQSGGRSDWRAAELNIILIPELLQSAAVREFFAFCRAISIKCKSRCIFAWFWYVF